MNEDIQNDFENEIWESLLKASVIENSLNEISSYPSEQELNTLSIPKNYDIKIRNLIKHYHKRQHIISVTRYSKKIASILILIMGISFSVLLSFEDVRAACQNVIIQIYEKYVQFDFSANNPSAKDFHCAYIPEGYVLIESNKNDFDLQLKYKNASNDTIQLFVSFQHSTSYIDNEHYIISNIQVREHDGIFFESIDNDFQNCITWQTENENFILFSSLPQNIMLKIAENIK